MTDLFDTVINSDAADRPPFRQAPPGDYLAKVREVKEVKANSGNRGIELTFTLLEAYHDADMEGVELSKCNLRDTQWVTEAALPYVQERLVRINADTKGVSIREAMEILPGSEVVVKIKHVTENSRGEPLRTPRLEVTSYYTLDWYMTNKRAA